MVARLEVDRSDLQRSAHQLSGWHEESNQFFASGHADIQEATSGGWVGDSRVAMEAALERIRRSAEALTGSLGAHAERFHGAVPIYNDGEDTSRDEFIRVGSDIPFGMRA